MRLLVERWLTHPCPQAKALDELHTVYKNLCEFERMRATGVEFRPEALTSTLDIALLIVLGLRKLDEGERG